MATLSEEDFLSQSLKNAAPAFRFTLEVANTYAGVFSECTLPNIEWDIEEVKEGGLNTYVHQLPGQQKSSSRIVLKTGVMMGASNTLANWYVDSMKATFARKTVTIKLLDSHGKPLIIWQLQDAFPVKWTAPQLKSDSNALAINSLELACGKIDVTLGEE
jgi:phage tail-like protein